MGGADPEMEERLERLVVLALEEDVGPGDRTSEWTVPERLRARAWIVAKERSVVAGLEAVERTFLALDGEARVEPYVRDGAWVETGETVARIEAGARALLAGERTALNFLGRLSGIATLTRRFVEAVEGTGVRIVDTRKTTPGWRALEKAAVRWGGGENHRFGLYDMVLVKENHAALAGGIREAVRRVREANRKGLVVEVEVRSLEELEEALGAGVERILLDNMSVEDLREAVRRAAESSPRPLLEASGNVTLERVRAIAETGVDLISVGALTHSAPARDFSLLVEG